MCVCVCMYVCVCVKRCGGDWHREAVHPDLWWLLLAEVVHIVAPPQEKRTAGSKFSVSTCTDTPQNTDKSPKNERGKGCSLVSEKVQDFGCSRTCGAWDTDVGGLVGAPPATVNPSPSLLPLFFDDLGLLAPYSSSSSAPSPSLSLFLHPVFMISSLFSHILIASTTSNSSRSSSPTCRECRIVRKNPECKARSRCGPDHHHRNLGFSGC